MKKLFIFFSLCALMLACSEETRVNEPIETTEQAMSISLQEAERLIVLPLQCIDIQYPNKLNQVVGGKSDLQEPENLHPAFYGCFDWHSAVHGHWSLVRLIKKYPGLKEAEAIIQGLEAHLSKENIHGEIRYFKNEINQGFERMYGWAWMLKLSDEINGWDRPEAKNLKRNLEPLALLIEEMVIEFLPKLQYPLRDGTHTNTAFAMSLIYDYAVNDDRKLLKEAIEKRAMDFYYNDTDCPLTWEPGGYDFLSPCLEEANLMRRVLNRNEFKNWLDKFLPALGNHDFELKPGIVKDRSDGHLVHLDGLNFSRAWCLYGIAETLPEYKHLIKVANAHIRHSLPEIVDGNYEGGHWLASFALLALR